MFLEEAEQRVQEMQRSDAYQRQKKKTEEQRDAHMAHVTNVVLKGWTDGARWNAHVRWVAGGLGAGTSHPCAHAHAHTRGP